VERKRKEDRGTGTVPAGSGPVKHGVGVDKVRGSCIGKGTTSICTS
jgi:hypothetical protein